jgi:hypothetical protein
MGRRDSKFQQLSPFFHDVKEGLEAECGGSMYPGPEDAVPGNKTVDEIKRRS